MVSLKEKHSYLREFEDKPKIQSFLNLIDKKVDLNLTESTNDTDMCYFEMIQALAKNSKNDFFASYEEFTRRKPSIDSPWLYNDFLIFVLIVGISKFSIDNSWVKNVLDIRNNANQNFQTVNQTLKNILSGNLSSTDNIHEVVIVYQELQNLPQLPQDLLNTTYLKLSNQSNLLEKHNDFMTIISIKAFDIIVITKDTPDAVEVKNLKSFKIDFEKRVSIIGDIIYYSLLATIVITTLSYYQASEGFKSFIDDLGAILSIIGIALLAGIKVIRNWIRNFLNYIFGFSKNFLNNKNKK